MPYLSRPTWPENSRGLSGIEDSLAVMPLGFLFDFLCLVVRDLPQLPLLPVLVLPVILALPFRSRCIAVSGSPGCGTASPFGRSKITAESHAPETSVQAPHRSVRTIVAG
jgi:hypothetical protein